MTPELLAIEWRPRAIPLEPCAVAATGRAAIALARRVLSRDDAALRQLQGAAGTGLLVLAGAEKDLPWTDGALYFGRDAEAPSLFLPTHSMPQVPVGLLELALLRAHSGMTPPVLVFAQPPRVVSLVAARPIDRSVLERWVLAQEAA